jgi:hypothetical protein
MSIEITEHRPGRDIAPFVRFPHELFADEPAWVPPLDKFAYAQLTPKQNPFFDHADVALFTASRGGRVVGRISAQIDGEHQHKWQDGAGFFGFFDTIDDADVGVALMHKAEDWLRARGVQRMRGPFSLSINEEVGTLVDGFDAPPMVMMGHHKPYQGSIIEAAGLAKIKDLYAWRYDIGEVPARAQQARKLVEAMPEVKIRVIDPKRIEHEMTQVIAIQDDAWKENWGHVSLTHKEGQALLKQFKALLQPEMAVVAEIGGEIVGMAIAIPNLNEAISDLGGRLFPFGWLKLLRRMHFSRPKTARMCLLGIKHSIRSKQLYAPLALALIAEVQSRARGIGVEMAELSWTLEDNHPVNAVIRAVRGKIYKRYRLYEKEL